MQNNSRGYSIRINFANNGIECAARLMKNVKDMVLLVILSE